MIHEEDDMIVFKETLGLSNHYETVDLKKSTFICITNEVHQQINFLTKHHLFESNYGAKKVC